MAWVLAPSNKLVLHFEDDRGKHSVMDLFVDNSVTDPAGTGPAAISTAAAALSDSALYETEIQIVAEQNTPASYGTSPYDRPSDKAMLPFHAADGSIAHIQIGAPLALMLRGNTGWLRAAAALGLSGRARSQSSDAERARMEAELEFIRRFVDTPTNEIAKGKLKRLSRELFAIRALLEPMGHTVIDASSAISSFGVPWKITCPPCSPAPGPRSMT